MGWKEDFAGHLRALWPDVVEVPGWKDHGNGSTWLEGHPLGSMNHHLVVPEDQNYERTQLVPMIRDGHSQLSGPLANGGIAFDGTIYLIAGNPANHAGRGRLDVLNRVRQNMPPRGNAADVYGSESDDYDYGNRVYLGVELQHLGTHPDYPDVQIRATYAWNAAFCQTFGYPPERCIHHRQHSWRKIDLSWRGDLIAGTRLTLDGTIKPPTEDDMPYSEADLKRIIGEVVDSKVRGIAADAAEARRLAGIAVGYEPKDGTVERSIHDQVFLARVPHDHSGDTLFFQDVFRDLNERSVATRDIVGQIQAAVTTPKG